MGFSVLFLTGIYYYTLNIHTLHSMFSKTFKEFSSALFTKKNLYTRIDWQVEDDFAFSLFELDWDVFESNIAGSIQRVPAVETAGIKSTICGPG